MSIINILLKLSPALEKGQSLVKADTWANRANATAAVLIVLQFALITLAQFGVVIPLGPVELKTVADAASAIGLAVVSYIHTAANKDCGVTKKVIKDTI
jgi:hypothetical protein